MSQSAHSASPPRRPRRVHTLPMRYRQISPLVFNPPAGWVPPRAAVCRRREPEPEASIHRDASGLRVVQDKQHVEQAQTHQRLLLQKDAEIEELSNRIRRLERSERRIKARLLESNDKVANKDAELGEVRRALHTAEESLSGKDKALRELIREVHHYQGWWLNEYYCLKVALTLARNPNDEGVKAMKISSHARFMKWSGSHQP